MSGYSLPTRQRCFEIIKEHHVPSHILRHSIAVAKLAVFLAKRLVEKNVAVDVELVERASLLHDIARVCDFKEPDWGMFEQQVTEEDKAEWAELRDRYGSVSHEEAAYDILKDEYPVVALAIRRGWYMGMLDEKSRPSTWEEKIVFYADMRVLDDKIVPLQERLLEGHKRNIHLHGTKGQGRINTAKVDPLIYKLEEEIFGRIELEPEEAAQELIDSYSDAVGD
jgi:putative nucleotidyltransferase with HDIG domain